MSYSVSRLPPQQQPVVGGSSNGRPKIRRPSVPVNSACNHCRRLHARCEDERPCKRCVSSGREKNCFDPEHKKRGRPRIYDVNIHRASFEIAPRKIEVTPAHMLQGRFSQHHLTPGCGKPTPVPLELRRDSSCFIGSASTSPRDLQFPRRDSSSSEASWGGMAGRQSLVLPGAGTPPDTPSFPVWRDPFAPDGGKWMCAKAVSDGGSDWRKDEMKPVPHPEAKKGRCLSIDELLS